MTTGSTRRISAERGWAPSKLPTGPTGRPLCRRCGAEVGKGRRTFCGDDCVHEHRIRTDPGYVRRCLEERDHGICRSCGLDTVELRRQLFNEMECRGLRAATWRQTYTRQGLEQFQDSVERRHGIRYHVLMGRTSLWDADHILEVVEGGGECGLENYQTLCLGCHRRKTADLAARRAERRRLERTGQPRLLELAR